MSGQWPREWDDPDWEDQDQEGSAAEQDAAEADRPELAEVTAALAALPVPALPDAVEARITAALASEARAAEAAARATETSASAEPAPHTLDRGRPRRVRPRTRPRRGVRFRPVAVIGPLVALLLLGGLGYVMTLSGGSSSSSSAVSEPYASSGRSAAGALPEPAAGFPTSRPPAGDAHPLQAGEHPAFVITPSHAQYQQGTLVPQVSQALAAHKQQAKAATPGALSPASTAAGSSGSAPSAAATYAPSGTLAGCVLRVTGNVVPALVEYASYQGKPAYVIVVSHRVWIVGTGCSASDPKVIASASLAGG